MAHHQINRRVVLRPVRRRGERGPQALVRQPGHLPPVDAQGVAGVLSSGRGRRLDPPVPRPAVVADEQVGRVGGGADGQVTADREHGVRVQRRLATAPVLHPCEVDHAAVEVDHGQRQGSQVAGQERAVEPQQPGRQQQGAVGHGQEGGVEVVGGVQRGAGVDGRLERSGVGLGEVGAEPDRLAVDAVRLPTGSGPVEERRHVDHLPLPRRGRLAGDRPGEAAEPRRPGLGGGAVGPDGQDEAGDGVGVVVVRPPPQLPGAARLVSLPQVGDEGRGQLAQRQRRAVQVHRPVGVAVDDLLHPLGQDRQHVGQGHRLGDVPLLAGHRLVPAVPGREQPVGRPHGLVALAKVAEPVGVAVHGCAVEDGCGGRGGSTGRSDRRKSISIGVLSHESSADMKTVCAAFQDRTIKPLWHSSGTRSPTAKRSASNGLRQSYRAANGSATLIPIVPICSGLFGPLWRGLWRKVWRTPAALATADLAGKRGVL